MDDRLLSSLFFPNGRSAKNRIWLAPMTNQQSHSDGQLSDRELTFLKARSQGGFGVIETCATHVSLDGQAWEGELGIHSDAMLPGWKRLADEMHQDNALLIAQLFHGGARALPNIAHNAPWSPSAQTETSNSPAVRAATAADIERTIHNFVEAARRVEMAGGDGIEIHGAHGYLLCQFMSTTVNQRDDAWGGSLENRARLVRAITRGIRQRVRPDFIVGVRLSPENFGNLTGLDIDESLQVASWLVDDGADFIHISLWDSTAMSQKYPDTHPSTLFRRHLPETIPLIVAGNIWTRDDARTQLDHGADAVALGRSALTNPRWPIAVASENQAPVRPPITPRELEQRALSPTFVDYMRRWPGFVDDE